jgi:polyhydroxyalkanoate synthase subunit PhaC
MDLRDLIDASGDALRRAAETARLTADSALVSVGQTPRELVWSLGRAMLYRYSAPRTTARRGKTLLLVYALINKPYIFDLLPGRSFIEFMLGRGYDVYLLDWGAPGPEDRHTRFDDYAVGILPRAMRRLLRVSGAEKAHVLGYCIGGTLAVLYAALHPQAPIRSLTLLAPPIDFSQREASVFARWLDERYFDVDRLVEAYGNIPPELIELGSKLLKPVENYVGVYANIWDRLDDPKAAESWQAMHRWVHDGVPFAGEAFRQWVKDYVRANQLAEGTLVVRGERVDLTHIHAPLLNVVARQDHIVPLSYSASLMDMVSSADKHLEIIPSGHVGLMGGRGARSVLWPKIADWLDNHS